jgi:bifunctional dihydroflavonol 4-reductase/flavanone 4-reductase
MAVVNLTILLAANQKRTKPLLDLPGASKQLTLWKADLSEPGSFDDAIKGSTGVFHVATPMDFESKDPEVHCCDPILVHRIDCNK